MDPIVTVDAQQRVIMFNPAAERAFGWPCSAVVGQPMEMLIPERFRCEHRTHVECFTRTGITSRRMGGQLPLWALRANGEEFPIEASISQYVLGERRVLTVILRDISDRMTNERR